MAMAEGRAVDPVDEILPPVRLAPLGLQHVLVMYAGAVAVPLIVGRALKLAPQDVAFLISADFLTVNVSSPNTEKLRDLQGADALAALLDGVIRARDALPNRPPVFVKIAPDLDDEALAQIASVAMAAPVDAIIATNTTLSRDGIDPTHAQQAGGLSGAPLFDRSTRILARLARLTARRVPLIGVGGIGSTDQAWEKLRAGASAVQIYSALIYQGFSLAARIAQELDDRLTRQRMTLPELTGSGIDDWL